MELKDFEQYLERKGQLTRIQVNILRTDLDLLTRYAAYVTKTKNSRLTVADLCQLAIREYIDKHGDTLNERMGGFEYTPRSKGKKKSGGVEPTGKVK